MPVAALMLLALVAGPLAAQAASCPARLTPARLLPSGWFVSPEAAAVLDDEVLVLGWPRYHVEGWKDGKPLLTTHAIGGMLSGTSVDSPAVVDPMRPPLILDAPRVLSISPGEARVTFIGTPEYASGVGLDSAVELWTGRLTRNGWQGLEKLGDVAPRASLGRDIGSGFLRLADTLMMAFAAAPTSIQAPVTILRQVGDAHAFETIDFGMMYVGYVDIAVHGAELWIAFTGSRWIREAGVAEQGIFVARRAAAGWSRPELVVSHEAKTTYRPRLLSSSDGLRVAWLERYAESQVLAWRFLGAGVPSTTHEQRFNGLAFVRGEPPFDHLMSAGVNDSTAKVWFLGSKGVTEIATIPTVMGAPPLVFGTVDHPLAVGVVLESFTPEPMPRMAIYDLRCARSALSSTHERPDSSP